MRRFEIEEPSTADIEFLEDRLYEFNAGTTGISDGRSLGIFLRAKPRTSWQGPRATRGEKHASCVRSGWQRSFAAAVLAVV